MDPWNGGLYWVIGLGMNRWGAAKYDEMPKNCDETKNLMLNPPGTCAQCRASAEIVSVFIFDEISTPMPATDVSSYISDHPEWADELQFLHQCLSRPDLETTIKWGIPTYVLEGKNIVSLAAFKNHCALWFTHGVFLKDSAGVLQNAQKDKTRGMRQWRIEKGESIDADLIRAYVEEAIENQRRGEEIKPQKKELTLPEELKHAFAEHPELKKAFGTLTPGKQREYADHIVSAKREATRTARLEKCLPMIMNGVGLNDKYK